MCVKWWFQKFDLQILKSVTCLGFFNIKEFYQGWNFGCFWWNFLNINLICCTYQNLCMTFRNVFGFLLNFSASWKNLKSDFLGHCSFTQLFHDAEKLRRKPKIFVKVIQSFWYVQHIRLIFKKFHQKQPKFQPW